MSTETVEAVVVTHRRPKNLLPVLAALRAQTRPLACITVIDAAPSDAFRPTAGFDLADRVMRLGQNFGAFNRYVPLLAYRSEFTLFVDDDFAIGRDAVQRLVEVSALCSNFGVIGEIGRSFQPSLEYSYQDLRAVDTDLRPVDALIRGYFVRTKTLPAIAEMFWRLPAEWQHPCIQFDDLLLCAAMRLRGLPCLTYRPREHEERMIARELDADFGLCRRRTHGTERMNFLRMARERFGWQPLSATA
jgi:hypothetical protein